MRSNKKTGFVMAMGLVIIVVVCLLALFFLNNNNTMRSSVKKEVTTTKISSSLISEKILDETASMPKKQNIFDGLAKEVTPSEYVKNIYGKVVGLYLIMGNNQDMRTQRLAQIMYAQKDKLHNKVPIYYIDAARYLNGNNSEEKLLVIQMLNGLNLTKITNNENLTNVHFESTMYANKLTMIGEKKAYTNYIAKNETFTDEKNLLRFFDAANKKLN